VCLEQETNSLDSDNNVVKIQLEYATSEQNETNTSVIPSLSTKWNVFLHLVTYCNESGLCDAGVVSGFSGAVCNDASLGVLDPSVPPSSDCCPGDL
jgi:hypothetical protein